MNDLGKRGLAAMIFFTRIPIGWKGELDSRHFDRIIEWWPVIGIITGGLTALVYWGGSYLFPQIVAVTVALVFRMLLTGGLHEDGLADFCDGFLCNATKEKTLDIIKDSFIGSYGVLGLIFYVLLFCSSIASLPVGLGASLIFSSDVWCKYCSSRIIDFLPYARTREESKSKTVYEKPATLTILVLGILSAAPLFLIKYPMILGGLSVPIVVIILIGIMKRRIGGYTGDCCGATFLISQLAMILSVLALYYA